MSLGSAKLLTSVRRRKDLAVIELEQAGSFRSKKPPGLFTSGFP